MCPILKEGSDYLRCYAGCANHAYVRDLPCIRAQQAQMTRNCDVEPLTPPTCVMRRKTDRLALSYVHLNVYITHT